MFEFVLTQSSKRNLKVLAGLPFIQQFYLAGGTGCALHLGHRVSEDFDFFARKKFDHALIQESLRDQGDFIADYSDDNTLTGRFNEIKISFFYYDYPLILEKQSYLSLDVASIEDIGCMKIDAISSRGKKRDFVDIYFILKSKKIELREFMDFFNTKYSHHGYNLYHILKSLVYFEDAEKDPSLKMLVEFSWQELKDFFKHQVKNFGVPHNQ